jgi:serine/threonine-protein kinase
MTASSPPSPTPALPQRLEGGTTVGRYVIDGWLRDGGMASLYRGHHAKTGAKVAIKVQLTRGAEDLVSAARFEREGQVMGRLSGMPHVVQVHDVDQLPDGRRYLVMEWLEGDNLEELLDDLRNADRPMDVERACRLMKDVALALAAAHRAEIVHRDLKPSNIMIDHGRGDRETAKLVDFGISADLDAADGSVDLTATGVVLGTSGYVAPEQALGLPAHPSFDVYAFGVVLFEALTGYRPPPEGLVLERLPSITSLRSSVPTDLAELVTACLQRDPSKRPPDAQALVERLDVVIRGLHRVQPSVTARVGGTEGREVAEGDACSDELGQRDEAVGRSRGPWAIVAAVVGAMAMLAVGAVVSRCGESGGETTHGDSVPAVAAEGPASTSSTAEGAMGTEPASASGPSTGTGSEPRPDASVGSAALAISTRGEPDPSSTGPLTVEAATDDDETTPGPKGPPRDATGEACERTRRRALDASDDRKWEAALRETSDRRCWPTAEQRNDRKALRAKALAELGRFEQCIEEGAGSTDPRVARVTKLCRMRIAKDPE